MKRLCVVVLLVLSACSSSSSSSLTTTAREVETTTTEPGDTNDADSNSSREECETVRTTPLPIIEDSGSGDDTYAPSVLTTDVVGDSEGNKIVAGLLSNRADFDYTDSVKSVGVNGLNMKFIAKFDRESRFLWIKCLYVDEIWREFQGSTVDVDRLGNIYVCDRQLEKYDKDGNLLWLLPSSGTACATRADGTTVTASTGISLISPDGKELWYVNNEDAGLPNWPMWGAVDFSSDGSVVASSHTTTAKFSATGKLLWSLTRDYRTDLSPIGLIQDATQSTNQTGLFVDDDNSVLIATSINTDVDFDPSSKVKSIKSGWVQDVAVAKYSSAGSLVWAVKLEIPKTTPKTIRYIEAVDISQTPTGDFLIHGAGNPDGYGGLYLTQFLVKFTKDGMQLRFLWLDKTDSFSHNTGRHHFTNSKGRTFVTSETVDIPPFVLSRDM